MNVNMGFMHTVQAGQMGKWSLFCLTILSAKVNASSSTIYYFTLLWVFNDSAVVLPNFMLNVCCLASFNINSLYKFLSQRSSSFERWISNTLYICNHLQYHLFLLVAVWHYICRFIRWVDLIVRINYCLTWTLSMSILS